MLFDWDAGNREKCQKHGMSIEEIEAVLLGEPYIGPNRIAGAETRFHAIGHTPEGRIAFVVFTWREAGDELAVRPISARYMRAKEVKKHEQDREG